MNYEQVIATSYTRYIPVHSMNAAGTTWRGQMHSQNETRASIMHERECDVTPPQRTGVLRQDLANHI